MPNRSNLQQHLGIRGAVRAREASRRKMLEVAKVF
jgi:hypothetical protein